MKTFVCSLSHRQSLCLRCKHIYVVNKDFGACFLLLDRFSCGGGLVNHGFCSHRKSPGLIQHDHISKYDELQPP